MAAARIDDLLSVMTDVVETGGVRLVLDQTILRDDRVITSARVTVVAIKMSGGPARLPADPAGAAGAQGVASDSLC